MAFKFGKDEGVPGHKRRMAALEMAKQREHASDMATADAVGMGLSIAGAIAGGIFGGPAGASAGFKGGQALGSLGKAAVASGQGRSGEATEHLKGAIGAGLSTAADIEGMEEGAEVAKEASGIETKTSALTDLSDDDSWADKWIEKGERVKEDRRLAKLDIKKKAAAERIWGESMAADAGLRDIYRGRK